MEQLSGENKFFDKNWMFHITRTEWKYTKSLELTKWKKKLFLQYYKCICAYDLYGFENNSLCYTFITSYCILLNYSCTSTVPKPRTAAHLSATVNVVPGRDRSDRGFWPRVGKFQFISNIFMLNYKRPYFWSDWAIFNQ